VIRPPSSRTAISLLPCDGSVPRILHLQNSVQHRGIFQFRLLPSGVCTVFVPADPANWHFWHFSPLEEPITYVESMVCKSLTPAALP
jgi:hypothetical protein